jgi:hypothetical protein
VATRPGCPPRSTWRRRAIGTVGMTAAANRVARILAVLHDLRPKALRSTLPRSPLSRVSMTPTEPATPMPPVPEVHGNSLSDVLLERLGRETRPQDQSPELVLATLEREPSVNALLAASTMLIGKSALAKGPLARGRRSRPTCTPSPSNASAPSVAPPPSTSCRGPAYLRHRPQGFRQVQLRRPARTQRVPRNNCRSPS